MAAFTGNFKNRTLHAEGDESMFKNRTLKWRPDMRCLWVALLVTVNCCHGYQEQRFIMEPQDQNAILGSEVTLPCRVESKIGSLQWTKDDFGLGTHRNLSGYERYKMIGSDVEGDYSLHIRNVTLDDDAIYQCQVSSGLNGEPGIRSRSAQLTVLVAPDPPKITQGAFIDATEEKPVEIECVSIGGKPAAEISWVDSNQVVIKTGIDSRAELLSDGQRYITRSVLRLTPSKEHHNQSITCQAQNLADRASRMATIHLEVKYAPKVKVFVKSEDDNERVPEGSEARIGCNVDANPLPKQYMWYINNKPVIGDYDQEMIIFNVSRKLNGAIVECEVGNSVGVSTEKMVLEVTYPPSFKTRPKNVEAEDGDTVTLNCDVDGYPQPEIRWLLYEPGRIGQVKGKTANLKVKASNTTAGRYLCKANVDGYPEIEAHANVFIKGPPQIISNLTQFGMEGEMVTIDCAALSVPKPDDISWFFNGREISVIHNQEYAIIETPLSDGIVKTSLVIKSSYSKHFGIYNCSITNEYGNANEGILLKPHKTFPLIMILVAVTSIIVILSLIILLIICCRRKRRNAGVSEKTDVKGTNSDYKESDRSSNISDFKVPHGDGTYDLDYTSSNTGSNLKLAGLPLAGPVSLPNIRHDDPLMQFRYSNDYSDPMFADAYLKAPGYLSYAEYTPDYPLPPGLRVQSPTQLDIANGNRSHQGSLTRSIDTASTVPISGGNSSQNNSLQRTKPQDESDSINNLGLPVGNEGPPIYAQPTTKGTLHNGGVLPSGLDVRFAATYGNPYLRANVGGFGAQGQSMKPIATSAPPPYSARNSVVAPSSNTSQPSQATHV